jgi:tetratricopeptide (TPR) repeat protein
LQSLVGDKSEHHLKKVYDALHERFFKKYNPAANFGDFIVNGEYNYLSASILYACVLENLSVPYQIIQYPAHVYVVANPGTDNIKFETIDPSSGVYFVNAQSKQKAVINFIKAGYLDQSYVIRVGVERAFDDFIYDKQEISLQEAVGILYFNRAMNEADAGMAAPAYSDVCKSDMLFPDKKNGYFKNSFLLAMTDSFKYNDMADWHALTTLVNAPNATDDLKRYLNGQFENFINEKLINAGQKDKVTEVYNYLHSNVKDTAIKKQVAKDYFFESAHYYVITNDYDQALDCMEVDYSLDPNNPLVTSDLTQIILTKYGNMPPTAPNLKLFDTYVEQHPALKNNLVIASIYEYFYGILGQMGYLTGNGLTGEKYLKLMEDELDTHPGNNNRYARAIAGLFAKASIYYFRKQQHQKAIEVLKAGLKYEPTDEELQRKLAADGGN